LVHGESIGVLSIKALREKIFKVKEMNMLLNNYPKNRGDDFKI